MVLNIFFGQNPKGGVEAFSQQYLAGFITSSPHRNPLYTPHVPYGSRACALSNPIFSPHPESASHDLAAGSDEEEGPWSHQALLQPQASPEPLSYPHHHHMPDGMMDSLVGGEGATVQHAAPRMAHFGSAARPTVPPLQLAGLVTDGVDDGPVLVAPPVGDAGSPRPSTAGSSGGSSDDASSCDGQDDDVEDVADDEYQPHDHHLDERWPSSREEDLAHSQQCTDWVHDNDHALYSVNAEVNTPFDQPSAAPPSLPSSPPTQLGHPLTACWSTAASPHPLEQSLGSARDLPYALHTFSQCKGGSHAEQGADDLDGAQLQAPSCAPFNKQTRSGVEAWDSALDTLRTSIKRLSACPSLNNSPRALTHRCV